MPKSKYNLPLNFEGKVFFTSKLITLTSILVTSMIIWNAVNNINKIGTITNVLYFDHAIERNIIFNKNLTYSNIKLEPLIYFNYEKSINLNS